MCGAPLSFSLRPSPRPSIPSKLISPATTDRTHSLCTLPHPPLTPLQPAPTTVAKDAAANDFCEFPAINPAYRGRPYRYAYVLSAVRPTNMGNALSKIDVETGDAKTWHEKGAAVGEPQRGAQCDGGTHPGDGGHGRQVHVGASGI